MAVDDELFTVEQLGFEPPVDEYLNTVKVIHIKDTGFTDPYKAAVFELFFEFIQFFVRGKNFCTAVDKGFFIHAFKVEDTVGTDALIRAVIGTDIQELIVFPQQINGLLQLRFHLGIAYINLRFCVVGGLCQCQFHGFGLLCFTVALSYHVAFQK